MNSLTGQNSWNFFKNDFSTHVPEPFGKILEIGKAKFASATPWILTVGTSHFAEFSQSGQSIGEPIFPFKVRFHPTGEIAFPDEYSGTSYLDQLMTILKDSTLYQVYGWDAPEEMGGVEHLIGDLITTSEMTTSYFADSQLFFRH
jgi:hypothetical protein